MCFVTCLSLKKIISLTLLHVYWYEGIRSLETVCIDCCDMPCWCWELSSSPFKEQTVLLVPESSLQVCNISLLSVF